MQDTFVYYYCNALVTSLFVTRIRRFHKIERNSYTVRVHPMNVKRRNMCVNIFIDKVLQTTNLKFE